ncbi:MAG: enoyl-CoA hydratase/isomerase family protein, partial [Verrucomicrobia bacterium]|nr:enoyl-CoA hydratase/isomerase family protein [Verrucomicrobiota bacterium]
NIWNFDTLDELDCHIEELHHDSSVRALVIRSAKERIFIAGADLHAVQKLAPNRMKELLVLGQDVFTHLETLRIPKVAAIHGACLGGGFELALACDWRVASDSDFTKIGLPETQLGLIPGWGGSTRLPRLIGLPNALDLIVRGKILKATAAKRAGLIHEVTAREHLDTLARKFALRTTNVRHHHFHFTQLWPLPQLLRFKVKATLFAKFPWMKTMPAAPAVAVDVITHGASRSFEKSLALEQEAITTLADSSMSRSFIGAFLRKESASHKLPATLANVAARPVVNAAVIGAGVMGSGIAYALATKGVRVTLADSTPDLVALGLGRIESFLAEGVKRHALSRKEARDVRERISPTHEGVPLQRMDLVIEAIIEEMKTKKRLLADLASRTSSHTILATNTSALSVAEMAANIPHPERVLGLHFFNPAHIMPLVEIVTHARTSPEATATALRFVQSIGKTPVLVQDSPGFVVNRILMPYLIGAVSLAETMHDAWRIDDAMTEFGMPMGPLRLLDEIGFDVAQHVAATMNRAFPGRLPNTTLLATLVSAGMLGRKNGQGFYLHNKSVASPNPAVLKYLTPAFHEPDRTAIVTRLSGLMRDEAQRCLDEHVAASAVDIELAMMLGTGFPPFRKLFE